MKNLKLLGAAAVMSVALTGCIGDSDETSSSFEISVGPTGQSIAAGSSLDLTGEISSDAVLDSVDITISSEGLSDMELMYVGVECKDESSCPDPTKGDLEEIDLSALKLSASEGACNGDYTLTVYAESNGATSTKDLAFTVTDGDDCEAAALTEAAEAGILYNINGPTGETGAFDLVAEKGLASSDDEAAKDLLDISAVGEGQKATFSSANGATFVVAADFDYDAATDKSAEEAYMAGTAAASVDGLEVGSIVIVKLAEDREVSFAVLKITDIDPEAGASTGGNTGTITFTYKK